MSIILRQEELEDRIKIREVHIASFPNGENEANLVDAIRESEGYVPELSLVALPDDNSSLIGHILFSKVTIETENENVTTLALAPMAVHPSYQNKGFGSKLVNYGIEICRNMGYPHIVVLGHPNFYPKFGFVPASFFGIRPPFSVPDEVFMLLELNKDSLENVKGKVKYPPSFNSVT